MEELAEDVVRSILTARQGTSSVVIWRKLANREKKNQGREGLCSDSTVDRLFHRWNRESRGKYWPSLVSTREKPRIRSRNFELLGTQGAASEILEFLGIHAVSLSEVLTSKYRPYDDDLQIYTDQGKKIPPHAGGNIDAGPRPLAKAIASVFVFVRRFRSAEVLSVCGSRGQEQN